MKTYRTGDVVRAVRPLSYRDVRLPAGTRLVVQVPGKALTLRATRCPSCGVRHEVGFVSPHDVEPAPDDALDLPL